MTHCPLQVNSSIMKTKNNNFLAHKRSEIENSALIYIKSLVVVSAMPPGRNYLQMR